METINIIYNYLNTFHTFWLISNLAEIDKHLL